MQRDLDFINKQKYINFIKLCYIIDSNIKSIRTNSMVLSRNLKLSSLLTFFCFFSNPILAVEIPEDVKFLECTETNILGRTEFKRSALLTFKEKVTNMSLGLEIKYFIMSYPNASLNNEYTISNVISSRDGHYLSDEISSSRQYYVNNCGDTKSITADFYWFTATGDGGPESCLTCIIK